MRRKLLLWALIAALCVGMCPGVWAAMGDDPGVTKEYDAAEPETEPGDTDVTPEDEPGQPEIPETPIEVSPVDEEEPEPSIEPAIPEESEEPEEETFVETEVWINPLYRGVIDENDLNELQEDGRTRAATVDVYYTEVAPAAAVVRSCLERREESVTFGYMVAEKADFSDQETKTGARYEIFAMAFDHTGAPTQGDYLALQYAGWKYKASYTKNGEDGYLVEATFTFTYYTTAAEEQQVTAAVQSLLGSLELDGKSDEQKIRAVYDWVCDNVTYDYEHLFDSTYKKKYTAYGALIDHTCICQGYTVLLYRLALELGIDARVITSLGMNHAWNIVRLDDVYYYLDATWETTEQNEDYRYYLKGAGLLPNHSAGDQYADGSFAARYPLASGNYSLYAMENGEAELEYQTTVWDGQPKTPAVIVTFDGESLTEGTDYGVSYSDNTDIGRAGVKITGLGRYSGSLTLGFDIMPQSPALSPVAIQDGGLFLQWGEVSGAYGYFVYRMDGDGDFVLVETTAETEYLDERVADGVTYWYKVVAYTMVNGESYCSADSETVFEKWTAKPEPSPEPTTSPEPSPAPTTSPEPSPEPTISPEPSPAPTTSPEPSPEPTISPEPSPEPTTSPEPSPAPTTSPEPSPAPTTSPEPSPAPSVQPSPSIEPAPTMTPVPSSSPGPGTSPVKPPETGDHTNLPLWILVLAISGLCLLLAVGKQNRGSNAR